MKLAFWQAKMYGVETPLTKKIHAAKVSSSTAPPANE
jgi:hypothetical protein